MKERDEQVIRQLQATLLSKIQAGDKCGPFYAAVVYGVGTESVERIAGFGEGFKPNWRDEFARRNIEVVGPVVPEVGEAVLVEYMRSQGVVYSPKR